MIFSWNIKVLFSPLKTRLNFNDIDPLLQLICDLTKCDDRQTETKNVIENSNQRHEKSTENITVH